MTPNIETNARASELDSPSVIARLKATIATELARYADQSRSFALLDFPHYSNVGDNAIWLGELAYFRSVHGAKPAFVSTKDNWSPDALERAAPDGAIFLSGGGNFGDIWPEQQAFRESVLARFPNRLVVQLPQTIHFADAEGHRRVAQAITKHGNFVLFVRDRRSYDLATSLYDCPVHMAPDMAFWIGPRPRSTAVTHRLLMLLRTDKESNRTNPPMPADLPADAILADWIDEDPALYFKQKWRSALESSLTLGIGAFEKSKQRELLFRNLATYQVNRGMKLLSSASFVITDRLHCHILCILLGIPHVILDNSYQKLGAFVDAWTRGCDLVQVANSLEQALELSAAQIEDRGSPHV